MICDKSNETITHELPCGNFAAAWKKERAPFDSFHSNHQEFMIKPMKGFYMSYP